MEGDFSQRKKVSNLCAQTIIGSEVSIAYTKTNFTTWKVVMMQGSKKWPAI